ncbi:MAG TPA: energy transducer TonB [Rhizomicrobium sp.]|jgi:protein TonB
MSVVLVGLIHAGVILAIVSGLASAQLMKKVEDITTEVIKEKPPETPKVPPPPPPELVKPPPPFVPPPDITVSTEAPVTNTITTQSTIQHVEPKPAVTSPAAVGRPHVCPQAKWYPPLALRLSHEGTTILAFTVNTDGTISNISVAQSSGHEELDQAAVSCAQSWSNYKPALQNGQPVAVPWKATVRWNLQGG